MPRRTDKTCGICYNKFDKGCKRLICDGECKFRFHVDCVFTTTVIGLDGLNKNWKCKKCCQDNSEQDLTKIEIETVEKHSNNALEHKGLQKTTMTDGKMKCLQKRKIPKGLEKAEYPFKWPRNHRYRSKRYYNICDKLNDYKNQGPDFGFEKICYLLNLVCVNSWLSVEESIHISLDEEDRPISTTSHNENKSKEISEDEYSPEKVYILCREALDEMAMHKGDVMYTRIGAALEHVVSATRAHMLFQRGDLIGSEIIINSLKPVSEMRIEIKAGIEGIKGKFILCTTKKTRDALTPTLRAISMDPTFGAWHYQSGKIIRRLRSESNENRTIKVIEYFEKAVELERNPKYLVFLAEAYQKMAFFVSKDKPMSEEVDEFNRKAALLYRESWVLQKDSASICRRIGNGMKNLRGKYQDIDLSKKALEKANEIRPTEDTLLQLGALLYTFFKDDEASLECFQRVRGIHGTAKEINLKLIRDPSYDPEDLIDYWKEISPKQIKSNTLYCDIGWYYLFFKNDLTMSAKYFGKFLETGKYSKWRRIKVTEFNSFPFCVRRPVNMLKVLVNEILLMKEEKIPPGENEDMAFLEAFLQNIYEKEPDMLEIKIEPNLKQDIKNDVDGTITAMRRKRYGYTTKKIAKESESRWRRQESQPKDIVDDRFNRNWRSQDCKEYDVASNRLMKYQEHETASYESESRRCQRAFMDRKSNNNNLNQQEGSSYSFENERYNLAYRENKERREHNRRQFTNNTRYDLIVTDWRSENKNGGS